jgi:hypothetical protein
MTGAIFAMLFAATAARGIDTRLQHLVFVLVTVGIAGFASGLLADSTIMKRIFAPTMGAGLLIGLAMFAYGLLPERGTAAEPRVRGEPAG